ncbi:LytR/AlgR family response regulator transcription factor [Melioribacter sp. OK-6-Me]|uniref:LytR/AlgR family response regulator transcription factor n=1 Tax=unclassified Melioribacter TaxID=2627329 RepID=UPI003ED8B69A
MKKIKALIVDDEKLARDIVAEYLSDYEEFEIVGECSNGFEAIKMLNEVKPDLIFIDIQMPKITGFEMLELIDEPPAIIFTTAFDQYAIKAFEVNAVDYLLKPFSKERFKAALEKAKMYIGNKSELLNKLNKLKEADKEKGEWLERVVLKHNSKILIIPANEIIYIEAQDDYVMLHTERGKFLKQKTMRWFEKNLNSDNFLRLHRSFIARLDAIVQLEPYEKESYKAILKNGDKISVSKSGYQRLKKLMNR